MTSQSDKYTVETWYDRSSRNWVTQIKDAEGNQIGSALFAGHKSGAKFNHNYSLSLAVRLDAQAN